MLKYNATCRFWHVFFRAVSPCSGSNSQTGAAGQSGLVGNGPSGGSKKRQQSTEGGMLVWKESGESVYLEGEIKRNLGGLGYEF